MKRERMPEARPRPILAGVGFRFLKVGELIHRGDQFFTKAGLWSPALNCFGVVSQAFKNLYRRRVHSRTAA